MESRPSSWRRRVRIVGSFFLGVAALAGVGALALQATEEPAPLRLAPVLENSLEATVSARGTLAPGQVEEVGTELTGRVVSIPVEENERVEAGQVLAEIDAAEQRFAVQRHRAQLAAARSLVRVQEATRREAVVTLRRVEPLTEEGLESPSR